MNAPATKADSATVFTTEKFPVNYEAAKLALTECRQIDECKGWADKAEAIASYAKQIKDETLLNAAKRIKGRAVRRYGELIREIESQQGERSDLKLRDAVAPKLTKSKMAKEVGISERPGNYRPLGTARHRQRRTARPVQTSLPNDSRMCRYRRMQGLGGQVSRFSQLC